MPIGGRGGRKRRRFPILETKPANMLLRVGAMRVGRAVDVFVIHRDGVGQGVGLAVANATLRVEDMQAVVPIPFPKILGGFLPKVGRIDVSLGIYGHGLDLGRILVRRGWPGGISQRTRRRVDRRIDNHATLVVAGGHPHAVVVQAIPIELVRSRLDRSNRLQRPDDVSLLVEDLAADLRVASGGYPN